MNSQEFLSLIKNGNQLGPEGFRSAIKLHENFPYFLIPKILSAKYEWQQSKGKSSELLHSAAILSPDRKRLKQLIEKPLNFLPEEIINTDSRTTISDTEVLSEEKSPEMENPPASQSEIEKPMEKEVPEGKPKREEILRRLEENLKKIKKSGAGEEISPEEKKKEEKPEEIMLPPVNVNEGVDLITSIERKKIIKPLDDSEEQNDIINKFNEKPIRLSREKIGEHDELPDLSEKSTALNENTVSESFAKLLVKQGKKEEASVIYQKLILKFPEKSTYFADQISKLKAKNT